jgi:hypothetical protein
MTDDSQPDNQQDSGGIVVEAGGRRLRVGKDEARTLLGYTGSAWRAVVYAIAFAITFLAAVCYGVSLLQ